MLKSLITGTFALLLLVLPGTEQPDAASLGGRVVNDAAAPIAGATISVRNTFTGDTSITTSDPSGVYLFTGVPKGRYSALAIAEGHGCVWAPNIFVYSGKHTKRDFVLPRMKAVGKAETCGEPRRSQS